MRLVHILKKSIYYPLHPIRLQIICRLMNWSRRVNHLRQEMIAAAKRTDFIEAAKFRDEMLTTQALLDSKLNSDESK